MDGHFITYKTPIGNFTEYVKHMDDAGIADLVTKLITGKEPFRKIKHNDEVVFLGSELMKNSVISYSRV